MIAFRLTTGPMPAGAISLHVDDEWSEHVVAFSELGLDDGADVTGLLWSADTPGPFVFGLDELALVRDE